VRGRRGIKKLESRAVDDGKKNKRYGHQPVGEKGNIWGDKPKVKLG